MSPPSVRLTHTGSELQEFTMPSPDDVRFGSSPDFQRWHFGTMAAKAVRGSGAEPDDSDLSSDDSDGPGRVRTAEASDNTEPEPETVSGG